MIKPAPTIQHGGYSFIEVLVSITILLIAIVGPLTIASKGLQNAYFAREQNIAFFLAQEGLEGIHNMHLGSALESFDAGQDGSQSWDWVGAVPSDCLNSNEPCGIVLSDGSNHGVLIACDELPDGCALRYRNPATDGTFRYPYEHASGGGNLSPYTRSIYFEEIANGEIIRVRSVVSWDARSFGSIRTVELENYLYNTSKYELVL